MGYSLWLVAGDTLRKWKFLNNHPKAPAMKIKFVAYLNAHTPQDIKDMFCTSISRGSAWILCCTQLDHSLVPGLVRVTVVSPKTTASSPPQEQGHVLHIPLACVDWIAEREQPFQGLTASP
jgi:hypothetical protein